MLKALEAGSKKLSVYYKATEQAHGSLYAIVLEGTTTKERRERKKNHYSLEVRDAGFIYPADHPNSGSVCQTTNMHCMHVWEAIQQIGTILAP